MWNHLNHFQCPNKRVLSGERIVFRMQVNLRSVVNTDHCRLYSHCPLTQSNQRNRNSVAAIDLWETLVWKRFRSVRQCSVFEQKPHQTLKLYSIALHIHTRVKPVSQSQRFASWWKHCIFTKCSFCHTATAFFPSSSSMDTCLYFSNSRRSSSSL